MSKQVNYTIQILPAKGGGFVATVPALPGCITQGNTYEEIIDHSREAIRSYLTSLLKDGESIPEDPQFIGTAIIGVEAHDQMTV